MQPTEHSALAIVLDHALALRPADQRKLAEAMAAISGARVLGAPPVSEVAETNLVPIEAWLKSVEQHSPWERLQLIDSSLDQDMAIEDEAILQAARRSLLADHPQVAARRTVRDLAARHPVALVGGGLGLLLAVVAMGRGAWRIVF